jgi:N-acetylglucosamine malate deacetylase 2
MSGMKPVVAIFAHPDDEAFGPAGTLALLAKTRDVSLICVTDGAAGMNSSTKTSSLADIRREELLASAKMLGIKKVFFLHYTDGSLSNNLYHEVAEKIQELLSDIKPELLMTYEHRGVSGHLDHIAVSFITTYVFEKLSFVKELWYFGITEERRKAFDDYYIYFPQGYKESEIDKTMDVSSVWEQKLQSIHAHQSQLHDVEKILAGYHALPKEESFLLYKKQ